MMRTLFTSLAILYAGVMLMGSGEPRQALLLEVEEEAGSVGVNLVAQSPIAQRVSYQIELTGASTSRHSGSTNIPADERQVLSRMRTSFADRWCAVAQVTEENGRTYDLTAGDCRS